MPSVCSRRGLDMYQLRPSVYGDDTLAVKLLLPIDMEPFAVN